MHTNLRYFLLLFICVAFGIINYYVPYVLDDDVYACRFADYTPEAEIGVSLEDPIQTYKDVFVSQYYHYCSSNGRSVIHFLVQCFCGLWGKASYNVFSTFLLFALFLLLGQLSNAKKDKSHTIFIFFPLLFFILSLSQPRCLYNGISYGMNYLFATVLVLSFALVCLRDIKNRYLQVGSLIISFLAGWSHEGLVIGLMGGILSYWLYKKQVNKWQIARMFLFGLGAALLILSPGNFNRASSFNGSYWTTFGSLLSFEWKQMVILFISLSAYKYCEEKPIIELLSKEIVWVMAVLCSAFFILVSKSVYSRSLYGLDLYMSILTLRILFRFLTPKILLFLERISGIALISAMLFIIPLQMSAFNRYSFIENALSQNKKKL